MDCYPIRHTVTLYGTMTAQRFVREILQPLLLPLLIGLWRAIFQQDNALPNTESVLKDCFHQITPLPWPIRSSVLSQFEPICLPFGQQDGKLSSLVELEVRLHQLRKEKPWDIKRDLHAFYPARIASCRCVSGNLKESKNFLSFAFFSAKNDHFALDLYSCTYMNAVFTYTVRTEGDKRVLFENLRWKDGPKWNPRVAHRCESEVGMHYGRI